MSDGGIVDWRLAERFAQGLAGDPEVADPAFSRAGIREACEEASARVVAYTGLETGGEVPPGEAVGRPEWTLSALRSLRDMSAPIEERLASGLGLPGPLGSVSRSVAGTAAAAEAGAAVGLAARHVLGQFEVSLGAAERKPRLLLVAPNLAGAHAQIGGNAEAFLLWIATHEVTHAVQFAATPWLRGHLRRELQGLLEAAGDGIDRGELAAAARRLLTTDPRRTLKGLLRGELATALAGPAQQERLDRLQAAMSTVEGYAEHVMDSADPARQDERLRLRARLEERRASRGGLGEVVVRLLGLEMKLRQYRLGKAFCDSVVEEAGIDALNRVWESPESLPTLAELEDPSAWLARTRGPQPASV